MTWKETTVYAVLIGLVAIVVVWLSVATHTETNKAIKKGTQEAKRMAATYPARGPWKVLDRLTSKTPLWLEDAKGNREFLPIYVSHTCIDEYFELREKDKLNLEYSSIKLEQSYGQHRGSDPRYLFGFYLIPHRIKK